MVSRTACGVGHGVAAAGGTGRWGSYPYSPERIEWMLTELANRPLSAKFRLRQLDKAGVPYEGSGELLVAAEVVDEDRPEWVQLRAESTLLSAEHDPMRPVVTQRWAGVLRVMAEQVDACFGHLCDDDAAVGRTALDAALSRGGEVMSVLQGRRLLRGDSWVTVCPAELAWRLGGMQALAASGAFAVVEQLPHGGIWLPATTDFDQQAVRKVFKALAPVLPAGKPERGPFDDRPRRLVWERPPATGDADDCRLTSDVARGEPKLGTRAGAQCGERPIQPDLGPRLHQPGRGPAGLLGDGAAIRVSAAGTATTVPRRVWCPYLGSVSKADHHLETGIRAPGQDWVSCR
jgi:hypothetical protein